MNSVIEKSPETTPIHLPAAQFHNELPATFGEQLVFRLGAEEYGIEILMVQEIRSYEAPTRIAHAPPCVKGVVNLRGAIVPIVDLRQKLGYDGNDFTSTTVVIVLNLKGRIVGAVVDSVSDVLALAPNSIKPVPQVQSSSDDSSILGIGCVQAGEQERMLILVNIEALMADTGIWPFADGAGF